MPPTIAQRDEKASRSPKTGKALCPIRKAPEGLKIAVNCTQRPTIRNNRARAMKNGCERFQVSLCCPSNCRTLSDALKNPLANRPSSVAK